MPTILAIDYGIKRIGLALSPEQLSLVMPFGCITKTDVEDLWFKQILLKVQEVHPEIIIIGLPLDMEGQETEMTARIRSFGDMLKGQVSAQIEYVDERFTTAQGKRMQGGVGDDEKAAMVILETYLSSQFKANSQ